MTNQALRRFILELWIIGLFICLLAVLQVLCEWGVDRAETFALRAARNYEVAALIQKTRELNQAALAVIRYQIENPCRCGTGTPFRRSTPLPGTGRIGHPERARSQSD
jgi:hypothetical protein